MFSNHFSDSTDSEQTTTRESFLPALPSLLRIKREEMPPSLNSIQIDECKIPLLEATQCKEKLNGYIKIPGNNGEKQKGRYSFVSSSELSDICIKQSYGKNKQNSFVTIFAVWNTIMGSSLLTMAWGIERAGLLPGIVLMMIMGGLCLFTSYVLLNVCYHHGDSDDCEVSDLCRMLLGRWAEVIAHIFSIIVMLGANVVYWVLMTNFLYHSVNYFKEMPFNDTQSLNDPYGGVMCPSQYANITLTDVNVETSRWGGRYWDLYSSVPIYVAVIIFPLLNFRSSTFFTKFNSLGTLSVVYLVLFVIIKGAGWGLHIESWAAEIVIKTDFSVLSGMLALSFYIHNIIITVMRSNKRQENNGRDLSIAFVLVTLTYILVGAVFYICFPLAKTCIEDNILNNFVKSDILTAVARILLLFQVVTVYPLIAFMLRVQLLGSNENSKINNTYSIMIFNLAMITICIIFACFVPKIGTIIRYTGALSGLIHVFTLPSLLQITSLHKRGELTICKIIFYFSIFLVGACNLLAQFFVVD